MRIRRRLAPPLSDLHLRRSEAAPPPHPPPDQNGRWALPKNEGKEFGEDDHEISNNDIRKIVNICDGGEGFNANPHPSSSSSLRDYELVPLKKREGIFERNPNKETTKLMKSKTNKKCGEAVAFGRNPAAAKKSKRGNVIMEGSRCSRVNGRGWRCCQPTLVGYSLCEHHLGKGRLRSMAAVRRQLRPAEEEESPSRTVVVATKKRSKVGVVKARSISSLLSQI